MASETGRMPQDIKEAIDAAMEAARKAPDRGGWWRGELVGRIRTALSAAEKERDEARLKGRGAAIRGILMASEAQDLEIDRLTAEARASALRLRGLLQQLLNVAEEMVDRAPVMTRDNALAMDMVRRALAAPPLDHGEPPPTEGWPTMRNSVGESIGLRPSPSAAPPTAAGPEKGTKP